MRPGGLLIHWFGGGEQRARASPGIHAGTLNGETMLVSVHLKKWFDQTHWSVGYCPACDRTEALRIGRWINTTSLYFVVTIAREVGETIACCDFCGRGAKPDEDAGVVAVDGWSYRDGIAKLFGLCAPAYDFGPPRFSTEAEVTGL